MNSNKQLTVALPKKPTSITLPEDAGKALRLFNSTQRKWVNWAELSIGGVDDPVNAVLELKKLGADIKTRYNDRLSSKWDRFAEAEQYKYCGWHFDANSPKCTASPYKESV